VNIFPSLRALQDAHRVLLRRYRETGITPELQAEIDRFLRSGTETGRILGAVSDQAAAQALLDYWSTILYRESKDTPESLLAEFDPNAGPQLAVDECPYVGLRSFRKNENRLFFGRESLIRNLLQLLRVANFIVVIGPPNSGRTSLVQAGLLAALSHDQLPGSASWPVYEVCPPLNGHIASATDLTSVTVIDDCDDIFAGDSQKTEQDFKLVVPQTDAPGKRRIIVLVLRSDYEDRFAQFSALAERIKEGHVRITSPTAKELHEAIEYPAELVGLRFDDGVVDTIVHDLVGERAAFALLQFTMLRLWEKRVGNRITWKVLHEVGIGRTAVVRVARSFYQNLSSPQQMLLRQLLVRLSAAAQPAGVPRHVVAAASDDAEESERLLDALAQVGLVSISPRANGESTVRLADDSLIEHWDRLADWLSEEREQLNRRWRLETKTTEWVELGRPKDTALLRELEAVETDEWLNSSAGRRIGASDDLRAFVATSLWWHERRVRRLKLGLTALTIGVALFLATTVFAVYYWLEAERATELANQATELANQARADEHLQSELTLIGLMRQQILTIDNDILSAQTFASQLRTSQSRALRPQSSGEEKERAAEVGSQVADLEKHRHDLLIRKDQLAKYRAQTIANIGTENVRLWKEKTGSERETILSDVAQMITSSQFRTDNQSETFSLGSKLRMVLFAMAAIPQNDLGWNDALRNLIDTYRGRKTYPPLVGQIWGVAFNPKNPHQVALGDEVGIVRLWDPFASQPGSAAKELWSAASGIVNGVAFSPDGTLLAGAYRSWGAVVWDLQTSNVLCALDPAVKSYRDIGSYAVAFSPDGSILAVAGSDKTARLWDLRGCRERSQVFRHSDDVFGVAFHPDGRLFATASGDGTVSVWRLDQTDEPFRKFILGKPAFAVAFSPTGKTLVASGAEGTARIFDIETKQETDFTPSHSGTLGQVAFSPDGNYVVATATDDGSAIVSDPNTGKMLYRLGGGLSDTPIQPRLFGVAFSPDSKYLLTGSLDGVARLWIMGKNEDNEIARADRNALISIGADQMGESSMLLSARECWILRNKGIPIFEFADKPWKENLKAISCPLPFLGLSAPAQ
jgi:WD40 repeat protein